MDIDLIDIIADEGYSASNLKGPGLQAALTMLRKAVLNVLTSVAPWEREAIVARARQGCSAWGPRPPPWSRGRRWGGGDHQDRPRGGTTCSVRTGTYLWWSRGGCCRWYRPQGQPSGRDRI